jgi:hypothetical protein
MGRWSSPRYQGCGHQELEGYVYEKGGMAKTSMEGQDLPWAVEPVMMMMKAIPVTDRGGPSGCETSRLPHLLHNQFTDGGEVISLTRRPADLYPQEDTWYSFLLEAESTPVS